MKKSYILIAACVVMAIAIVIVYAGEGKKHKNKGNGSSAAQNAGELFDIIMSSPATSSNSKDYLDAHEAEHKQLLADKEGTLKYIFEQFLNGQKGQPENGLKGVLMRTLLEELAPESVIDLAGPPQEYFNAWLDMAKQRTEGRDDKWIQKNYPAEYILLQML